MKITADTESVFFIRAEYLTVVDADDIAEGAEFLCEEEEDLLNAGLAFAAEKKACDYLARAEQSRAGLRRKLLAKNFDENAVDCVLDFLESEGFLSDARFARSWLNNRNIAHAEGRTKLLAGLLRRGVSRDVANTALDEFCAERTENERLSRAVEKIFRLAKNKNLSEEKIILKLMRQGFEYRAVKAELKKLH